MISFTLVEMVQGMKLIIENHSWSMKCRINYSSWKLSKDWVLGGPRWDLSLALQ